MLAMQPCLALVPAVRNSLLHCHLEGRWSAPAHLLSIMLQDPLTLPSCLPNHPPACLHGCLQVFLATLQVASRVFMTETLPQITHLLRRSATEFSATGLQSGLSLASAVHQAAVQVEAMRARGTLFGSAWAFKLSGEIAGSVLVGPTVFPKGRHGALRGASAVLQAGVQGLSV